MNESLCVDPIIPNTSFLNSIEKGKSVSDDVCHNHIKPVKSVFLYERVTESYRIAVSVV